MAAWYQLHHSQSPPADFEVSIATAKKKLAALSPGLAPPPAVPPSTDPPLLPFDFEKLDGDSVNYETGLAMLQMDLAIQGRLYKQAHDDYLVSKDDGELRKRQLAFQDASKAFQDAEKAKAKILADAGKTAPLALVAKVLQEIIGPIPKMLSHQLRACFDELPAPLREKHHDLPRATADRAAWRSFCDDFIDHICQAMHETRLAQVPAEIAKQAAAA